MNVNFHDKNFVTATLFHDYLRAAAPAWTIHVVAPLTILTCGIGACKRKTNRNNAEPFRQRLSIRLDVLGRRDTYGQFLLNRTEFAFNYRYVDCIIEHSIAYEYNKFLSSTAPLCSVISVSLLFGFLAGGFELANGWSSI